MATFNLNLELTIRPRPGQTEVDAAAEMREHLSHYLTGPHGPLLEDFGTVWDKNGDPTDDTPWGGYDGPTIDHITVS